MPGGLDVDCSRGGKNHVYRAGDVAWPAGVVPATLSAETPLAVVKTK